VSRAILIEDFQKKVRLHWGMNPRLKHKYHVEFSHFKVYSINVIARREGIAFMTFSELGQELTASTVIASCSSFYHFSLLILGVLMRDYQRGENTIDSR
jgi:hypothetical protein